MPPATTSVAHSLNRNDSCSAVIAWSVDLSDVRAGSALVESGDRLLVAQDDAYTLFWLHGLDPDRPVAPAMDAVALHADAGPLAKHSKPDFEAAADLPDGRIVVMGSGSAATRTFVVVMDPASGDYDLRDASRIYALVQQALGHELNIEAMLWTPDGLRLFHRGNSGQGNATIDLRIDPDDPVDVEVLAIRRWEIGSVPGANGRVGLTFTDADLDAQGRQWFLAAAEDTPNAIDDGPVVGAALGYLHGESGQWTLLQEADGSPSTRKAEGLVVDADLSGAWLVTDPDDEHACAQLCRVELRGW